MHEFSFMDLYSISLKNFRNYRECTSLVFSKVTAIVGPNDSGKSTILHALDIFFNDKKVTKNDFNVEALRDDPNCCIDIEIVFDNVPSRIVIDSTYWTSLKDKYLLDKDGRLHILKRFNLSNSEVFINAYHPINDGANDLLLQKNSELKKRLKILNIDDSGINKTTNAEMRKKIWEFYDEKKNGLIFDNSLILISSVELKNIYQEIKSFFPIFELFSVDRTNSDIDNEVQDPLQIAIKSVFQKKSVIDACKIISDEVKNEIDKVAEGTIKTFHDLSSNPNLNLHSNLLDVNDLKWVDVFKKVGLIDNNKIPLNQHGSGIRRLCILSFLIYSVERRAEEVKTNRSGERPPVIYAIEEPETSLHYDHQVKLMMALNNFDKNVNNLDRVIITTHSSNIVKEIEIGNIRIISNTPSGKKISTVQKTILPRPSLNEINYFVYGDISEGFHNELYGFLHLMCIEENNNRFVSEELFDDWLTKHSCEIYICKKWKNMKKKTGEFQKCTLQTYIRNYYHHPENTLNENYTKEDLSNSIRQMIDVANKIKQSYSES